MLNEAVEGCRRCGLGNIRKRATPGDGVYPALVLFIGEGPGEEEEKRGLPFVGAAGRYLDVLMQRCGLSRHINAFVDNVIKCRPPGNRDPRPDEIAACAMMWLDLAIEAVQPKIIVCLGAYSTRYISGIDDSMDHLHGVPIILGEDSKCPRAICLPVYHPAAGFYDTAKIRQIDHDFGVLAGLVMGKSPSEFIVKDEYPNPDYREVTSVAEAKELLQEPLYALDTETVDGEAWSVQVSNEPGRAYFIPGELYKVTETPKTSQVIVHNWLYDARFLDIPNYADTMVAAYLLGLPKGLKTLARQECGIQMLDYVDVVRPFRKDKAIAYLEELLRHDWPKPSPVAEEKWNNKTGTVEEKTRNPNPIPQTVKRILKDTEEKGADPFARWYKVDASVRSIVEESLGAMPDADLRDVADRKLAVEYACRDADATLRCWLKMEPMLKEQGLEFVFWSMDNPTLVMALSMMKTGMAVSIPRLKELSDYYSVKMMGAAEEVYRACGKRINPNSGPQVAALLYGDMGIKPFKMTDSGDRGSTSDDNLKRIEHPVIKPIIDYRMLAKNRDAYTDTLVPRARDDGNGCWRVHANIKTTTVETGRWAVEDPQLQAIPMRTEEGRKIRSAFVAPDGKLLISVDLDQVEVRFMAHESNCSFLIEVLCAGDRDIHTEMSAKIFSLSLEEAAEDNYRYPAKRATFGVIYGIEAESLHRTLIENEIYVFTVQDCAEMIKQWYLVNPEVREYRMAKANYARQHGYVKDMFNRRRYVPEILCPINHIRLAGERQAGNMPIQAGAQGAIKLSMMEVQHAIDTELWAANLVPLMQIHDELLFEAPGDTAFEQARRVKQIMEGVVQLKVPVTATAKIGRNWQDMEKVK